MAPNFLSKLVKVATNSSSTRERNGSSDSGSPRTSSVVSRGRSQSTSQNDSAPATSLNVPVPNINVVNSAANRSLDSLATESTQVNFTVVPPSPFLGHRDLSDTEDEDEDLKQSSAVPTKISSSSAGRTSTTTSTRTTPPAPPITVISPSDDTFDDFQTPVPTPKLPNPPSLSGSGPASGTNASSSTPVSSPSSNTMSTSASLSPGSFTLRKQSSNKSIKKVQPVTDMSVSTNHGRSATSPPETSTSSNQPDKGQVIFKPIVESPTDVKFSTNSNGTNSAQSSSIAAVTNGGGAPPIQQQTSNNPTSPSASTAQLQRENTAATISESGGKRLPWNRSTTRKPTGLASAIAASGLAMANPTLSPQYQNQISNQVTSPPGSPPMSKEQSSSSGRSRKGSASNTTPYMSRSPASSKSNHHKTRSTELSPRSTRSKKSSGRRRTSVSATSDGQSEYYANPNGSTLGADDVRPEYYSGLDEGSSDDEGSTSSSAEVSDDELGDVDIPVTGFAVASNKRNADFHELFPQVPEGDYLIEDYGCALQREILIQGRLYISENHICFHANIFGWITDLSLPIYEITSLEKKMTAFVIPNAVLITTRQAKYTFASFLARDTTYDVIYNIWRLARPGGTGVNGVEDNASVLSSGRGSLDGPGGQGSIEAVASQGGGPGAPAPKAGLPARKPTQCLCGKDGQHYSEGVMDIVISGTPEKIQSLMFGSPFLKDFLNTNQKVLDVHMTTWNQPLGKGAKRTFSYIKPLNGSVGPRQTKCEIEDEVMHYDLENYITIITTTRTPDVPSGGVFAVKTRTCVMWASAVSSRVIVTTQVEWSGRSLFKGMIEPAAINGQKSYHGELEKAMKAYISQHKADFLPEGADVSEGAGVAPGVDATPAAAALSAEKAEEERISQQKEDEERKKRQQLEKDKNKNKKGGLGDWAWDTFEGALGVAIKSTTGALELIKDAWDSTSSTTILWGVIGLLVVSNLWTLMRVGKAREEVVKKMETRKYEEREKWVQSIVTALWDELAAGKRPQGMMAIPTSPAGIIGGSTPVDQEPGVEAPKETPLPGFYVQTGDGEPGVPSTPSQWMVEVEQLLKTIDALEQRIGAIRQGLGTLQPINALD